VIQNLKIAESSVFIQYSRSFSTNTHREKLNVRQNMVTMIKNLILDLSEEKEPEILS